VKHALWLMLAESHLTFAPSSYAELSKMYSSPFGFTDIRGEAVVSMRHSWPRPGGISARAWGVREVTLGSKMMGK